MAAFPDNETRKIIEHYSGRIPLPEDRLEFVLRAMRAVRQDAPGSRPGIFGSWGRRLKTIDLLYRRYLLSGKLLGLGFGERVSLYVLPLWPLPPAAWKLSLAAVCLLVVFTQAAGIDFRQPQVQAPPPAELETAKTSAARPERNLEVWLVENEGREELYSNGLRVSNQWLTHTGPRAYGVYERGPGTEAREIDRRDRPAGIVFHTTESDLPALEKTNNQSIRYEGRKLLAYIRGEHLYHFVIDRFGQVHRIVPETEYAFHAGYSIWADGGELYINLNQSFIGVSFEARPASVGPDVPPEEGVTQAQFASARLLTQMLRERFGILASNCVTHEMVSINPYKMLIGYHTDWRGRFPFEKIGLPDNYQTELASVSEWGFDYDSLFVDALGGKVWPGVGRSQLRFRTEAASRGLSADRYRRQKKKRFSALMQEVRETTPAVTWAGHGRRPGADRLGPAKDRRSQHTSE